MTNCIICNSELKPYLQGSDIWLNTTSKDYHILKCTHCGLEKIHPSLEQSEIFQLYKSDYYSYGEVVENFFTKCRESIFVFMHSLLGVYSKSYDIERYPNGNGKNFLDIGCGNARIVKIMKKKGYFAEGFEIGESKKIDNIYYSHNISDIDFGKKYDLIFIGHVFEHIGNPVDFLATLHQLLKEGGKCIILIPNINCFSARLFRQFAMERDIPRHLYNYNFSNLDFFLENNGFTVVSKKKLKQYSFFDSLCLMIKSKYGIDISKGYLGSFLRMFSTLIIENILNLFKSTNQMGLIIMKK